MAHFLGWLGLGFVGAWSAFYCLRRAKGRKAAHWVGLAIATLAGFGMVGTIWTGALNWASSGIIAGGAGALVLIFGLPAAFDMLDGKPDTMAILAGLILPSVLAVGISQLWQFGSDAIDNVKQTNISVQQQAR